MNQTLPKPSMPDTVVELPLRQMALAPVKRLRHRMSSLPSALKSPTP